MKNPPFTYHRPTTVDEAVALLAEHGDDAKILAGGQSLLPILALRLGRPDHLIDIGRVAGLDAIDASDNGVTLGAMVTHATAERSPDIARHAPMISAAMPHVGHRAIRTRGTVVGSIAHADPAAEMPAVALATEATVIVRSSAGVREIAAANFFDGYLTTAVQSDELVTHVRFPAWSPTAGASVVEQSRRHGDYAIIGVAAMIDAPEGRIASAALSFFGAGGTPVRVAAAEAALVGAAPDEAAFAEAARIVTEELSPGPDVHASASYRRHLAGVLTRRGLAEAASRIGVPA